MNSPIDLSETTHWLKVKHMRKNLVEYATEGSILQDAEQFLKAIDRLNYKWKLMLSTSKDQGTLEDHTLSPLALLQQ